MCGKKVGKKVDLFLVRERHRLRGLERGPGEGAWRGGGIRPVIWCKMVAKIFQNFFQNVRPLYPTQALATSSKKPYTLSHAVR
jgi:hypothetical protein